MRGQRAEDVIHAGRQRMLGSAEVALTFECGPDEHREWSELSVARRLYRSGESEYLVNRARQRLRDVQATLRSIDIDNPRFIVVNQGMADFLLAATPMERRALLEQAAGLSAYRQRRDEAAQRLSATEGNIATAEVVLAELEPRLRLLRRQARAVEERSELESRLRARSLHWYGRRWQEASRRHSELRDELERAARERAQASEETERLEALAEGVLARERSWQHRLEAAIAALHTAERERDDARHESERIGHRVQSLRDTLERLRSAATQMDRDIGDRQRQLDEANVLLESLSTETGRLREVRATLDCELRHAETLLLQSRETVSSLSAEARAAEQAEEMLHRAMHALRVDLEHGERRAVELSAWLDAATQEHDQLGRALEGARAHADDLEREETGLASRVAALQSSSQDISRRASRLRRVHGRVEERRGVLARALAETDRARARLQGEVGDTILNMLQVAAGWDAAVAAALGHWALAARDDLEFLSDDQLHAFHAWRDGVTRALPVDVVWMEAVVHSSARLPAILSAALIVEDDKAASETWQAIKDLPAHLIGSPPLQVVSKTGASHGAAGRHSEPSDDRAARFLLLSREAGSLARGVGVYAERERRVGSAHAVMRFAEERASATLEAARGELEQVQRARAGHLIDLHQLERQIEHLAAERASREREKDELLARVDAARSQLRAREEELGAARARKAEVERALAVHARAADEAHAKSEELGQKAQELDRSLHETSARLDARRQVVAMLRRDVERLSDERRGIGGAEGSAVTEIESLEARRSEACARLSDLEAICLENGARVDGVREEKPQEAEMREPLRVARARASSAVGRHERAQARSEELEHERMRLSEEVFRELGLQVGALPTTFEGDAPSEDEIRRLRSRVLQYYDLDEGVIGEYREIQERQEYLTTQLRDLVEAADGLRQIMTLADEEMRTRFRAALVAVTEELRHVFRTMLRGGEAELVQVDADGGIEVRATLPGKRTRSSAAFSGGERALVASSLLFAVLRTRPTPFCVLDEVDAALDETNVDRYLAALREISERTQVIVVTHNRATMAAANALYGLTMDGDGASGVLSVRLDAYEAAG